jgi:hypothetical protein
MGFSGGGSNVTKAHTHDSTIVQDGGSLAANVTQFGLSAGSVLYGDGSNIQELLVGSASDTLTVNAGATAPEWAAAAGGGGNYTLAESFTLGGSASTFTCTLASPITVSGISEMVAVFSGTYTDVSSAGLELQIRTNNSTPITAAGYSWGYLNLMDGTSTTGVDVDHFLPGPSTTAAGSNCSIIMHIMVNATLTHRVNCLWNMAGTNVICTTGGGFTYENSALGGITSLDGIVLTNSAGNNIEVDSTVDIYQVTV